MPIKGASGEGVCVEWAVAWREKGLCKKRWRAHVNSVRTSSCLSLR